MSARLRSQLGKACLITAIVPLRVRRAARRRAISKLVTLDEPTSGNRQRAFQDPSLVSRERYTVCFVGPYSTTSSLPKLCDPR